MNITLERWEADDYQAFFAASNEEELYGNMSPSFPKSPGECKRLVHQFAASRDKTEYIRAIKSDDGIVGCIAAFYETDMYAQNAEIAYWLNSKYRSKGIMTRVIKMATETLFLEYGMHRIWARPFEQNRASQKVLEKSGFVYEGTLRESVYKDGHFLNAVIYALIK